MPSRWKTSGLFGSRRANAATNRESTAYRQLIGRLLGAYWALIGDYHNDCAARITAPFAQGVAPWQKPWKPGPGRREAHHRPTARDPAATANTATPPHTAAHTATGGVRGRRWA